MLAAQYCHTKMDLILDVHSQNAIDSFTVSKKINWQPSISSKIFKHQLYGSEIPLNYLLHEEIQFSSK
jgi:hypothetical protein